MTIFARNRRLRAVLGTRFALRVMDWRDSNIVLGEQMNTRGFDASMLLPSHKGVGILRPDGDTDTASDAVALTVRTYYMANPEWRAICSRGRSLREAAGTLPGHAAGNDDSSTIDHTAVANAIGTGEDGQSDVLPEPLAAVVDALDVEPTPFGRHMGEVGCQPRRGRTTSEDGVTRQVRGYYTADLRAAIEEHRNDSIADGEAVCDDE